LADYLAIAAGSGITPMMAIIDATLATEADSRFTLIYGNRSSHSMMFRQALADLKDRYPQRLQVVHLFSQESMDSDLLQGRIDGDKLRELAAHLLDFSRFDEAFICGPAAMMDEAEAPCASWAYRRNRFISNALIPRTAALSALPACRRRAARSRFVRTAATGHCPERGR
jgi:ferredoxin-NADP reductase